jgi:hypothetical protein
MAFGQNVGSDIHSWGDAHPNQDPEPTFWPKATFHRSLGQRPRNQEQETAVSAEGHNHPYPDVPHQETTMSQSHTKLYAHLIFSTKSRKPFLTDESQERAMVTWRRLFEV